MKTKPKLQFIVILCIILPLITFSQAETIFNGVKMNETLETVNGKLKSISKFSKVFTVNNPSFPLAKDKETHLVCVTVKTENGTIDKMVFTFADDKLSFIEAQGNVYEVLSSKRQDTARHYIDYDVYFKEGLFLKSSTDQAWILNQEAMHCNLFAWENPYLSSNYKAESKSNYSGKIPAFLKMGATIDELKPLLEANSKFTNTEELDGSDPNAQLQINCFGVDYAGFPRKMEARFGDNKLNVVWILTAKGEEDRIRQELIKHYGKPIFENDDWEIYDQWQIGLRKDKPEVLVMTKEIGQFYKTDYFKQ